MKQADDIASGRDSGADVAAHVVRGIGVAGEIPLARSVMLWGAVIMLILFGVLMAGMIWSSNEAEKRQHASAMQTGEIFKQLLDDQREERREFAALLERVIQQQCNP